jgi:hypothetical protein
MKRNRHTDPTKTSFRRIESEWLSLPSRQSVNEEGFPQFADHYPTGAIAEGLVL